MVARVFGMVSRHFGWLLGYCYAIATVLGLVTLVLLCGCYGFLGGF